MAQLKVADVKRSVQALLKKYGDDYVYSEYISLTGGECYYEDDSPSGGCLVGCVARDLIEFPEFIEQDIPDNQPWAHEFSPLAITFLREMQNRQDMSNSWGAAYQAALDAIKHEDNVSINA